MSNVLRFAVFVVAGPLLGQQYTYEVASIKPSNPSPEERYSSSFSTGGNGLRATNKSLFALICLALGAQDFQISGGPGWVKDARFDINAKNDVAEDADIPLTDRKNKEAREARIRSRVRHLLEERFQLILREEVKELPVYALTVDKPGPKLKVATDAKGHMGSTQGSGGGSLSGEGISLETFCVTLGDILERPVIDETGLDGFYDIEIKYSLDNSAGKNGALADVTGPSIFTAIRETLGLRLTGKKGPVKTWVIEKAEKPTEN